MPRDEQRPDRLHDQRIHVDVHNHDDPATRSLICELTRKVEKMSLELDRLTTEVSEMKGVTRSAVTLIEGLAEQIRAIKDDPAKLAALADELDSDANALGAAVAANTPATPPPA